MPANVETMMYTREKPWHGLGTRVEEAPCSAEALSLSGLDWRVEQRKLYLEDGTLIKGHVANVRSLDEKVLGVVTPRYKIVQNQDAFAFTDHLIDGEVHYETAGSLNGGRRVWMLAKLPTTSLAGDETEPYLCFSNTHDGTGAVQVCMTPVRVVCNNTLNLALSGARRKWSMHHTGDIQGKVREAQDCLGFAAKYMAQLEEQAQELIKTTVSDTQLKAVLNELYPIDEEATLRVQANAQRAQEEYMVCYWRPDIAKYLGTAWGAINAMADHVAHTPPQRRTKTYAENNFAEIVDGSKLVDQMTALLVR